MSIGAFTIIKNEAHWVGFCIMAAKDIASEFVYFDGNSTDGTPELLEYIRDKYKLNIKVFRGKDPDDLKDDYIRVFNECLSKVESKYAWFLHPDMIVTKAPKIKDMNDLSYSCRVKSFGGNPGKGTISFNETTRRLTWKTLMRNSLGLHYFGHYGAQNEDMYFREITGEEHLLHEDWSKYPYDVHDSGIELNHYSDVRTFARRYQRMFRVITTFAPNMPHKMVKGYVLSHPRVSLEDGDVYLDMKTTKESNVPDVFNKYAKEFSGVVGKTPEEFCYLPLEKYHD